MQPTPPKSAEQLRSALEKIHSQAPSAAKAGPLAEGLKPDDQLVIASFYDMDVRKRYQELLLAHSIGSSCQRRHGRDEVLIDVSDRELAARLRGEHVLACPDRLEARGRLVIDFILLGSVLGATVSAVFVIDKTLNQTRWGFVVLSVFAFTLFGAIVGGLLGALKQRVVARQRLQFTILDMLLLAAIVALASLIWRLR